MEDNSDGSPPSAAAALPPGISAALADARARGLPDGWTCSIDKRNRRKWTAPGTGRSCDSIPKALAMSVEMGLLPPDTVIERKSKKRKKGGRSSSSNTPTTSHKKKPPSTSSTTPSLLSLGSSTRPADSILRRDGHPGGVVSYKEVDEDDIDDDIDDMDDVAVAVTVPPKKKARPKAVATTCTTTTLPLTLNPETSLDVAGYAPATRSAACLPMTVHWDPDAPDGRKVGWRVWIPTLGRHARVHRYDPHTHKHYVVVDKDKDDDDDSRGTWIWLRNTKHQLRVATRIVWAHVKGYAWWPALVMESVVPQTTRDGFLWLEFFATGETSTLRDSDDCVRPFDPEQLDPIVAKHRKKRNQRAFQLASQEFATILRVRNAAAIGLAQAALDMAVVRVPKLLTVSSGKSSSSSSSSKTTIPAVGQRVRIFRSDVNYPYGDTVTGVVRQFSPAQKKWLVSFEDGAKYPATWLNLLAKEHTLKVLDSGATIQGPDRLLPFLYGYVPTKGSNEYATMLSDCCHACTQTVASAGGSTGKSSLAHELTVVCSSCEATFHVGCVDPPISLAQWQRMAREDTEFVCSRCTVCRGCYQKDIAFGSHPHPAPPPNVKLDGKVLLPLCSTCREHYDKERYCPNCAHVWDDTKYYLWRKEMPTVKLQRSGALLQDAPTGVQFGTFGSDELPLDFKIDPKLFYPETSEWGYTEDDMLVCDGCNVWLHASCSGLTPKEYTATSNGKHPIYSVEFLCYMCCRARCRAILEALQEEDRTMLFAVPVSEKDVPNYYDLIKEPMDLQTMEAKVEVEEFLNYVWVREDFELMVLNALRFNRYYTAVWREAKHFYLQAIANVFQKIAKAAKHTKFTDDIQKCFEDAEQAIKNEQERVQVDETIKKKDLIAGSEVVASFSLPDLRENPPDLSSCIPCTELQLNKVDAFYSSWMDCCFTCGSSGASDTFLFCVDCGEAFHSFCVSAPIRSMDLSSVAAWRCPNCKICEISGDVPADETRMIFCEMCDRAFSLDLLDPPLSTVPEGLWICGQCVDCQVCGNTAETEGPSSKFWSQNPLKCFRCGGSTCLMSGHMAKCQVCNKLLRSGDSDFLGCRMCGALVHSACDPAQQAMAADADSVVQKDTYLCPACNRSGTESSAPEQHQERALLVKLATDLLKDRPGDIDDKCSKENLFLQYMDQIDWALRSQYFDQFVAIARDGIDLYLEAKAIGDPRFVIQQVLQRMGHLPPWLGHRALRFATLVKLRGWDDVGFEPDRIETAFAIAKLAASFISVVCKTLGTSKERAVSDQKRMESLLIGPNEVGEVVHPTERLAVQHNTGRIRGKNPNIASNSSSSGMVCSPAQKARHPLERPCDMPRPLCGWGTRGRASMGIGGWKDPRECCLCKICGDSDSDFLETSPTSWKNDIPPLGRLLPLSDSGWVHSSCALWSSEVYETAADNRIHAMEKARSRGAQLKCFGCGHSGATVGCNKGNCPFNYHYACAKICGAVFTENRRVYCPNHKSSVSSELAEENNELMKALIIAPEPMKPKFFPDKDGSDSADPSFCPRYGSLIVHCFGDILMNRDEFHTEDYITPLGFVSSRIFWSAEEPRRRTMYLMKIEQNIEGKVQFSITPGESPSSKISASSVHEAYAALMEKVREVNADHFSQGDIFSKLPVVRQTRRKTFRLNGPQFFGFGLDPVRRRLEMTSGVEAVVAPLSSSSPIYQFCFSHGAEGKDSLEELVKDLQRRRVATKAEEALQNTSGCARTEGMKAVVKSGGSGRITRALVRFAEDDDTSTSTIAASTTKKAEDKAKVDRNVVQVQYKAMKEIPMSQRLAARRSHIHGWGLFTKTDIAKHSPVVEYMGEVITQRIADKRERSYELSGEGSCYMFRLDLTRVVDATKIGCMARFMNHSCDSNAYAKCITVDTEQGQDKKIVVFALRDISAGEEITYDYKFPVEDGSIRCGCGAPNCIGRLN